MTYRIVSTSARPEFAEITGPWRWDAFSRHSGMTLREALEAERDVAASPALMPQTLVLLASDEPIGMASLAERDLDERPDLSPWLAGVFIVEPARRRGHAARLVAAVEQLAASASIPTLWLYTRTAERIYARLGWCFVETLQHRGIDHALMRRDLTA